jgi:hypothetical protein
MNDTQEGMIMSSEVAQKVELWEVLQQFEASTTGQQLGEICMYMTRFPGINEQAYVTEEKPQEQSFTPHPSFFQKIQ